MTVWLPADVSVSCTADSPAPAVGDTVLFTLIAANLGPGAASGLVLQDVVPGGLSLLADEVTRGTHDAGTGMWQLGDLATGASDTLRLRVRVDPNTEGDALVAGAQVVALDQPDPVPANDGAQAQVDVLVPAGLALTKSVDRPAAAVGDTVLFTVHLSCGGPGDATGVVVTDLLPAGLAFVTAAPSVGSYDDQTGLWSVGTVLGGTAATLLVTATVDAGTEGMVLVNTAAVTASDLPDPEPDNDADDAAVSVAEPADLALELAVDETAPLAGAEVILTLTARNLGPGDADDITVASLLPTGLTLVAHEASAGTFGPAPGPGAGTWRPGPLATGAAETLRLTARVDPGTEGQDLTTTATVAFSDVPDPVPGNDVAAVTVDVILTADEVLTAAASDTTPLPGAPVTLTFSLLNQGPGDGTDAHAQVTLPAGLSLDLATPSTGTFAPQTGLWDVGALATGAQATLALDLTVGPATGGQTLSATGALVLATPLDPVPDNDAATLALEVPTTADLAATMTVDEPGPLPGETVAYTVAVANAGPFAATAVLVDHVVPTGLVVTTATATRGFYTLGSGIWSLGDLAPGQSDTLVVQARVDAGLGAVTLVSTATVHASAPLDPQPANDTAQAAVVVPATADLALSHDVSVPSAQPGDTVIFTVVWWLPAVPPPPVACRCSTCCRAPCCRSA